MGGKAPLGALLSRSNSRLVLKNPDMFVEAMVSKLLMYGLGRNVQYYDQPAIRQIQRDAAKAGNTFAAQVLGVASSMPFQNRMTRVAGK